MKTTYQDTISALFNDVPTDENTALYKVLMDEAWHIDVKLDSLKREVESLGRKVTLYAQNLEWEGSSVHPSNALHGGLDAIRDITNLQAGYVHGKNHMVTLVKAMLGESALNKFVEMIAKG